jgi:hypothetical protein
MHYPVYAGSDIVALVQAQEAAEVAKARGPYKKRLA